MFKQFLQIQYGLGKISEEQLRTLVSVKITAADFTEITGSAY